MVIPLSWDEDGITECAFVTRAFYRGKAVDQLQMHLKGGMGYSADPSSPPAPSQANSDALLGKESEETYRIVTVCFDHEGNELAPVGILPADGNKNVTIPFGKQDCTVFRKVMSTEDTIQEFAPALRTNEQIEAFRVSLQMLGDLIGFGINYFDTNESRGYVKTPTEVSSDNSALMRNIRRHENSLEGAIVSIAKAVMHASRSFGESIPEEGITRIQFDDSIIQDTAAEKEQDMKEAGVTMGAWEYRMRWYGEDESTAKRCASEIETAKR